MDEPVRVQPYETPENTTPLSNPLGEVSEVDWNSPNIARILDYHLGGHANFAVDREAGDELERIFPDELAYCRHNRGFLWRAVRMLADDSIDQFLDLGAGVPTVGNVHEIAQQRNPWARVAYVDVEPIAVAHARHLLGPTEQCVTVTQADVCEPETVLSAPGVTGLLDFTRPVAVLALGILDIIPTSDGAGLMAAYRDACCPGSALAVSNASMMSQSEASAEAVQNLFASTSTPQVHHRTRDEIAGLLPGYDLVEPGVVPTATWRPDEPVTDAARSNAYAAVGILQPQTP